MKKLCLLFINILIIYPIFAASLFTAKDGVTGSLFSDRRARKIGDIITVYISETSNAAQTGKTVLNKESSLASEIKSLFFSLAAAPTTKTDPLYQGMEYTGSKIGSHRGTLPASDWDSKNDFTGDAELSSSNKITGTITAMIIEVLPNGNFLIEGKRELRVDHQESLITLSGVVRPEDIGADNSVLSRYIAHAKISFNGDGPITQYRKSGLLTKLWNFLGIY